MAIERTPSAPILDIEGTLARFGGDKELFAEIVGLVLEDAPRLMDDLHSAVKAKDAAAIHSRAHALKGVVAGCGGVRAANVAQALEIAGQASDLSQAAALLETLNYELDQLTRALRQFRG